MINAVIQYTDGHINIHSSETTYVGKKFVKGFYEASMNNNNMVITTQKLEELHKPFASEENDTTLGTVEAFFKEEMMTKVNQLGFTHKLGILLHGIPGTGKTSTLQYIANNLVEQREAIVFFCNNENTLSTAIGLAKMIREIQQNPIIFIADEFERYAERAESEMKNLLDGNTSINNSLFLAATNYINKVPASLKDRKSRFKINLEIKGITDPQTMFDIIKGVSQKISPSLFTDEQIHEVVGGIVKQEGSVTLDDLKHICLDKLTDNYLTLPTKTVIGFQIGKKEKDLPESLTSMAFNSPLKQSAPVKVTDSNIGVNEGTQEAKSSF